MKNLFAFVSILFSIQAYAYNQKPVFYDCLSNVSVSAPSLNLKQPSSPLKSRLRIDVSKTFADLGAPPGTSSHRQLLIFNDFIPTAGPNSLLQIDAGYNDQNKQLISFNHVGSTVVIDHYIEGNVTLVNIDTSRYLPKVLGLSIDVNRTSGCMGCYTKASNFLKLQTISGSKNLKLLQTYKRNDGLANVIFSGTCVPQK
jgi:hypothetical protein